MPYRDHAGAEPSELERRIQPFLEADEKLRWVVAPRQGLVLRAFDVLLIPFSLVWCGFAISWETAVIVRGAPLYGPLFGLPFVAVGIYFVVGRFLWDAHVRRHSVYALSDDRLLLLVRGTLTSLPVEALRDLGLTERRDGGGTLALGDVPGAPRWTVGGWPTGHCVLDIQTGVRALYESIREAQARRRRPGAADAAEAGR